MMKIMITSTYRWNVKCFPFVDLVTGVNKTELKLRVGVLYLLLWEI